jgi:multiple sugar transport system substrate-binding protein
LDAHRGRGGARAAILALGFLALAPAACQRAEKPPEAAGPAVVSVWFHTGQPAERDTIERQVAAFNRARKAAGDPYRVELTLIPEGAFNAQVQAAVLAGDLPDLLEMDGPLLASYAWGGHLRPLTGLLPEATVADLIPSIVAQGTWNGTLYGVGTYDSGLGLFADLGKLAAAGIDPPAPGTAWSAARFREVLEALAQDDPDGQVLDLKRNYRGEWRTYGFYPLLLSAGADLIDRDRLRAAGTLDGPDALRALTEVQGWVDAGRVDPNLDDAAFVGGRVALSWVGHWEYRRYKEALGDRLAVLPLPDLGRGTRTAQGSWQWGVTTRAGHPQEAAAFLAFLLTPRQVLAMADANGAPPATRAATARSALYGPGGPLALFARQLRDGTAVPRPRTPAYPAITDAFQRAFSDVVAGADVAEALGRAARAIDRDVADNRGYPAEGAP